MIRNIKKLKTPFLLRGKLLCLSTSAMILLSHLQPVLAAVDPSRPQYLQIGTAQAFSCGMSTMWLTCGGGNGIALTDQYIGARNRPKKTSGYIVRFPKGAPQRFDTFRFSSKGPKPDTIGFILFFEDMKTGQTILHVLKGFNDVKITEGGQEWLHVPRKHFGFDPRFKDCRLYKIMVEYESPQPYLMEALYDIPVTFLDAKGYSSVEVHAKEISLQRLGPEAYRQDP